MSINHRYVPGKTEFLTEAPRHLLKTRAQAIQSELNDTKKPRGHHYKKRIASELGYINHELELRTADDEIIKQFEKEFSET